MFRGAVRTSSSPTPVHASIPPSRASGQAQHERGEGVRVNGGDGMACLPPAWVSWVAAYAATTIIFATRKSVGYAMRRKVLMTKPLAVIAAKAAIQDGALPASRMAHIRVGPPFVLRVPPLPFMLRVPSARTEGGCPPHPNPLPPGERGEYGLPPGERGRGRARRRRR